MNVIELFYFNRSAGKQKTVGLISLIFLTNIFVLKNYFVRSDLM